MVRVPGMPRSALAGLAALLLALGVIGCASSALGQPLDTAPPPSGPPTTGYWEAALDGGVFAFGSASFYGSMGGQSLNGAIKGIVATPDGKGYWLFASDGGVFAFGDAPFLGSPAVPSNARTPSMAFVGMASTSDGKGYWLVNAKGNVYAFGDASRTSEELAARRLTSGSSEWRPPPTARATGSWRLTVECSPSAIVPSTARWVVSRSVSPSSAS